MPRPVNRPRRPAVRRAEIPPGRLFADADDLSAKEAAVPADDESEAARKELKVLQRLYRITSSDESAAVLLDQGFTSAADVVSSSEEEFHASYAAKHLELYGKPAPDEESRLVYRRAVRLITEDETE